MSSYYFDQDILKISNIMDNILDLKKGAKKVGYNDVIGLNIVNDKDLLSASLNEVKVRKRRVTPVPNNDIQECIENELKKQNRKVYLFVEEEDADDLETYNTEVDYVSLDIIPNEKSVFEKRNSWHGENFKSDCSRRRNRLVSLTKTKSLDRGTDYKRRTRKTSIVVNRLEELTIGLDKSKGSCDNTTMDLPLWMREEKLPTWMRQAEVNTNQSNDSNNNHSNNKNNDESCVKENFMLNANNKYNSPLKEDQKLKEKTLFSNRRKELVKQKTLEEKRRHRKITPSKLSYSFSLDKLNELRNSSKNFELTEEEEEEEET